MGTFGVYHQSRIDIRMTMGYIPLEVPQLITPLSCDSQCVYLLACPRIMDQSELPSMNVTTIKNLAIAGM
jgi:hypothetical protein